MIRQRLRRGVIVGSVLIAMAGMFAAGWYINLQKQRQAATDRQQSGAGDRPSGRGMGMIRPTPATAETNGAAHPPVITPPPEPTVAPVAPRLIQRPSQAPAKRVFPRVQMITVTNGTPPAPVAKGPLYTLAVWTYIPCVLENILVSEIEGTFTVIITSPVLDATHSQVLIPQGRRVGARDTTSELLYGNERIPTFALSVSMPDGQPLELGEAPIMDGAGINGLTGDVDNNTWRIIWTSILVEGLRSGQQVAQTQLGIDGAGTLAGGLSRGGSRAAEKRLGRAQDTRPVITVHSGQLCQILVPKAFQLPSFGAI